MPASENPFPGMNPYLERRWDDFHAALATYTRDSIQDRLPDDLRARMQSRVFIETVDEVLPHVRRAFSPDVHVYKTVAAAPAASTADSDFTSAGSGSDVLIEPEPIIIHLPHMEVNERYLDIIDVATGGRVVTSIELISRSNKRSGPGRREYLRKRSECLKASVNVVEIDLLRGGEPVTLATPDLLAPQFRATYHACAHRADKPEQLEYYAAPLRSRLPTIRIPLRSSDKDITLDLQGLVDEAFRKGRYDDIDYAEPLNPPLAAEDAAWAGPLVVPRAGN